MSTSWKRFLDWWSERALPDEQDEYGAPRRPAETRFDLPVAGERGPTRGLWRSSGQGLARGRSASYERSVFFPPPAA